MLRTDVTVFKCDHCDETKKCACISIGLMSMWACANCLRSIAKTVDASRVPNG